MSEHGSHDAHSGRRFTFAELSTEAQMDRLSDYLYGLQREASDLRDEQGDSSDLHAEIEVAALLLSRSAAEWWPRIGPYITA